MFDVINITALNKLAKALPDANTYPYHLIFMQIVKEHLPFGVMAESKVKVVPFHKESFAGGNEIRAWVCDYPVIIGIDENINIIEDFNV